MTRSDKETNYRTCPGMTDTTQLECVDTVYESME